MFRINFLPAAARELDGIVSYLRDVFKSPVAVNNFLASLEKAKRTLQNNPNIFMVRHIVNDEEIRGIPIRNYMIFYTTYKDKNIVDILHIVHGSQNYQKYFEIEDNY